MTGHLSTPHTSLTLAILISADAHIVLCAAIRASLTESSSIRPPARASIVHRCPLAAWSLLLVEASRRAQLRARSERDAVAGRPVREAGGGGAPGSG